MTGLTPSTHLRMGTRATALLILLCLALANGALADPSGGMPQDALRGLIVKAGAANDYKLLTPLIGADDATTAALAKLLRDAQLSPRERMVAAVAFGYIRTPAALAALLAAPPDPQPAVRQGVAYALGYFRDETGAVREALTKMATTDAWNYTDPKTGVTRYFVREAAQGALKRLDKAQPLAAASATPPVIPVYAAAATPTEPAPGATPTASATPAASPAAAGWPLPPPVTKAPACLSTLQVSGTWEKTAESDGQLTKADDGRLTVSVPDAGLVTLSRAEPLPAGPWTLNLWRSTKTLDPDDKLTLTFGSPSGNPLHAVVVELSVCKWDAAVKVRLVEGTGERSQRLSVYHARGPVQWLQLSYTPQKTIEARLNGVAMPPWELGPVEMPLTPVTLSAHADKATAIQIASFTVEPYAPIVQPANTLLNGGWSTPPRRLADAEAGPLLQKLQGLASDATLPRPARVYSLAALALVQRAQTGQVSEALWQQLPPMQGGGPDQAWAVQAMPLLLACCSEAQRQAAAPLIKDAAAQIKSASGAPNVSRDDVKLRGGLFAPQTLAQLLSGSMHEIDQPRMTAWLEQVTKSDPCTGFTLWNTMPTNFNDPRFQAWVSGRVWALIPNYSRLLLENGLAGKWPEDTSCRAAIEIARTDRPAALALFAQMKNQSYREVAAAGLGVDATRVLTPAVAAAMEQGLRNSVAQWKPSRLEQTPVKPMLKVVEFLKQQGKVAEAAAMVRDMAAKVSALTAPRCGEIEAVMTGMDELQLPETAAWIDRGVAAAQAEDAAASEPDPGSGEVYLSATWHMVRWFFVPKGMIDRALTLALSLDPERMPMNYNNAMIAIINACAETQPQRIVELLPKLVGEERISLVDRQIQVMSKLFETPAIAAGTWPEQWINLLPPDKRFGPIVRLALIRGKPLAGELQDQFGQMLAAELKYTKPTRGNGWCHRGWALRQLEPMALSQLQQYEQFIRDDPDFYCYQLLNTVVRETGLADDPLWRLWKAPDQETAYQLPWELFGDQLKQLGPGAAQ